MNKKKHARELKNILEFSQLLLLSKVQYDGVVPIFNLVKMIAETMIYQNIYKSKKDMVGDIKDEIDNIKNALVYNIADLEKIVVVRQKPDIKIKLGKDPVLAFPWSKERLENSLIKYGTESHTWEEFPFNHDVHLCIPLGLSLVMGGNHSITSGIFKVVGEVSVKELYDISKLYDYVEFNGVDFVHKDSKKSIYTCKFSELGYLFEIGRVIRNKGVVFSDEIFKQED